MRYDCIVLTDKRYLSDSEDPYKHNVYAEDDFLVQALKSLNLKVCRKAWDDADVNWSEAKTIVFRTTWDYFDRFEEFSEWLNSTAKKTTLINSEALIRWNLDKHYLQDLKDSNIAVIKTKFIEKGTKTTLRKIHQELGWETTVIKPCISGAGRHTYKLNPGNLIKYEAVFKKLIASEALMLQPFQKNIVDQGELSMMVFNGRYSHAVLKKAKKGDFRVQDDFGGTVHHYTATAEEIKFAEQAVRACPELPIYARVDIVMDNDNIPAVSELELIEPELWFRYHPEAALLCAKAIEDKLKTL